MKTKILILGPKGMLGSMAMKYFTSKGYEVHHCGTRFESPHFADTINGFNKFSQVDFILNCVGAIPQKTNNFKVNTDLPIWLENNLNVATTRVIHPGTDCEMDNDNYGLSKKLASDYIKLYGTKTKILKTSIVGPEEGSGHGLMAWLGDQEGEVNGYTQAIWNGNTTLEWCKQAEQLMLNWDAYGTETVLEGKPISKFDMLKLFAEFYDKTITVKPINLGKNKCLTGTVKTKSLKEQLDELKEFITL
jgi:dTDP-4-dehydrorhamnose reductase